jgi:uncharacterized protein (TIGR02246 family)
MNGETWSQRDADEAKIRGLESAYDRAWNAADPASVLELFTNDAVVISPSGETSTGGGEIARSLASLLDGMAKGSKHSFEISAVRFIANDVALVDGEATITGLKAQNGHTLAVIRHRFTDVLVKTDLEWHIAQVRAYVFMPRPDT